MIFELIYSVQTQQLSSCRTNLGMNAVSIQSQSNFNFGIFFKKRVLDIYLQNHIKFCFLLIFARFEVNQLPVPKIV